MHTYKKLPLEENAKDEAKELKRSWDSGFYNFLLMRTKEKYKHSINKAKRLKIEKKLSLQFPEITDEMLLELYTHACTKYLHKIQKQYQNHSGFQKTPSEYAFTETLNTIIKNDPKLKHLEVYPSAHRAKDFPSDLKMVVGNYVPDFLIFGLKIEKFSAVAIEIDGESHIQKYSKDKIRNDHLKQLKIFNFEVQNHQANDLSFLTKAITKMYRLRNGSFNDQIQRAKRMIWTKTISCQLSLGEIEKFVSNNFSVQLNLETEATEFLELKNCPRKIRNELIKISLNQKP